MKNLLITIIDKYLKIFPEEKDRQNKLMTFLSENNNEEIIDWNNFNGHIVASGFIYARQERKLLVLYHNDLKMFIYPGGHINIDDFNPLVAAKREVKEETGIIDVEVLKISDDELVPIDIDTHIINYNERLKLPKHYHFDFRYLFFIDKISEINIDINESSKYKWITSEELLNDLNYGKVIEKIIKIL